MDHDDVNTKDITVFINEYLSFFESVEAIERTLRSQFYSKKTPRADNQLDGVTLPEKLFLHCCFETRGKYPTESRAATMFVAGALAMYLNYDESEWVSYRATLQEELKDNRVFLGILHGDREIFENSMTQSLGYSAPEEQWLSQHMLDKFGSELYNENRIIDNADISRGKKRVFTNILDILVKEYLNESNKHISSNNTENASELFIPHLNYYNAVTSVICAVILCVWANSKVEGVIYQNIIWITLGLGLMLFGASIVLVTKSHVSFPHK